MKKLSSSTKRVSIFIKTMKAVHTTLPVFSTLSKRLSFPPQLTRRTRGQTTRRIWSTHELPAVKHCDAKIVHEQDTRSPRARRQHEPAYLHTSFTHPKSAISTRYRRYKLSKFDRWGVVRGRRRHPVRFPKFNTPSCQQRLRSTVAVYVPAPRALIYRQRYRRRVHRVLRRGGKVFLVRSVRSGPNRRRPYTFVRHVSARFGFAALFYYNSLTSNSSYLRYKYRSRWFTLTRRVRLPKKYLRPLYRIRPKLRLQACNKLQRRLLVNRRPFTNTFCKLFTGQNFSYPGLQSRLQQLSGLIESKNLMQRPRFSTKVRRRTVRSFYLLRPQAGSSESAWTLHHPVRSATFAPQGQHRQLSRYQRRHKVRRRLRRQRWRKRQPKRRRLSFKRRAKCLRKRLHRLRAKGLLRFRRQRRQYFRRNTAVTYSALMRNALQVSADTKIAENLYTVTLLPFLMRQAGRNGAPLRRRTDSLAPKLLPVYKTNFHAPRSAPRRLVRAVCRQKRFSSRARVRAVFWTKLSPQSLQASSSSALSCILLGKNSLQRSNALPLLYETAPRRCLQAGLLLLRRRTFALRTSFRHRLQRKQRWIQTRQFRRRRSRYRHFRRLKHRRWFTRRIARRIHFSPESLRRKLRRRLARYAELHKRKPFWWMQRLLRRSERRKKQVEFPKKRKRCYRRWYHPTSKVTKRHYGRRRLQKRQQLILRRYLYIGTKICLLRRRVKVINARTLIPRRTSRQWRWVGRFKCFQLHRWRRIRRLRLPLETAPRRNSIVVRNTAPQTLLLFRSRSTALCTHQTRTVPAPLVLTTGHCSIPSSIGGNGRSLPLFVEEVSTKKLPRKAKKRRKYKLLLLPGNVQHLNSGRSSISERTFNTTPRDIAVKSLHRKKKTLPRSKK